MRRSDKRLGEIFIGKGLVTAEQLDEALKEQRLTREFLGAILVKRYYVSENDLLKALADQFNIPIVSLKDMYIDWDLAKQFSSSLIVQNKCFPFKKDEWAVTVAITNPLDAWALKKAQEEAGGLPVKFVLVSSGDMEDAIKRYNQFMRGMIFGKLG